MTARLLAFLAFVAVVVVVPASPASACSCVGLREVLRGDQDAAFVGTVRRQVTDSSRLITRFAVDEVFAGDVRRTQDVVSPDPDTDTCAVDWSEGDRVLVLADRDDADRLVTSLCRSAVETDEQYDAALAVLGEGAEPVAGVDRIEPEGLSRRDLLWVRLVVGLVGLAALGLLAVRWLRGRRTA